LLGTYLNELKSKTILITGATGFIGANLTRYLINIGCNVHVITREEANKWRIQDLLSQIKEYNCDLRDPDQLNKLVRVIEPDIVYHLAAYGSYPLLQQDLNTIIQTNIIGTLNLITALSKIKYEVLVNSGSSSEYGLKTEPMVESDVLKPINHYGASKAAASLFAQVFTKSFGQPIVTLRPFSVYGYYEEPTRLIPTVITACLRGKDLNLTKGEQVRDFVFIEDVVDAYVRASITKNIYGHIINIGSGNQYTVKEVVSRIIELCGNSVNANWGSIPYRDGETSFWVANNIKAKQLMDWEPQTGLDQGLMQTIDWFKNNLNLYGGCV
jgi:nucleoside-diphosphate-sugar epimerase